MLAWDALLIYANGTNHRKRKPTRHSRHRKLVLVRALAAAAATGLCPQGQSVQSGDAATAARPSASSILSVTRQGTVKFPDDTAILDLANVNEGGHFDSKASPLAVTSVGTFRIEREKQELRAKQLGDWTLDRKLYSSELVDLDGDDVLDVLLYGNTRPVRAMSIKGEPHWTYADPSRAKADMEKVLSMAWSVRVCGRCDSETGSIVVVGVGQALNILNGNGELLRSVSWLPFGESSTACVAQAQGSCYLIFIKESKIYANSLLGEAVHHADVPAGSGSIYSVRGAADQFIVYDYENWWLYRFDDGIEQVRRLEDHEPSLLKAGRRFRMGEELCYALPSVRLEQHAIAGFTGGAPLWYIYGEDGEVLYEEELPSAGGRPGLSYQPSIVVHETDEGADVYVGFGSALHYFRVTLEGDQ